MLLTQVTVGSPPEDDKHVTRKDKGSLGQRAGTACKRSRVPFPAWPCLSSQHSWGRARRPEIKVILHYNVKSRSALAYEILSHKKGRKGRREGGRKKRVGERREKERLGQHTRVILLKDWGF